MEEDFKNRLSDNEKEMEEMRKTFEEKLAAAQAAGGVSQGRGVEVVEGGEKRQGVEKWGKKDRKGWLLNF